MGFKIGNLTVHDKFTAHAGDVSPGIPAPGTTPSPAPRPEARTVERKGQGPADVSVLRDAVAATNAAMRGERVTAKKKDSKLSSVMDDVLKKRGQNR